MAEGQNLSISVLDKEMAKDRTNIFLFSIVLCDFKFNHFNPIKSHSNKKQFVLRNLV